VGKQSRKKRERRGAGAGSGASVGGHDARFVAIQRDLQSLFGRYSARDVLGSLCVSDLWPPNISSGVKHTLACSTAMSMTSEQFSQVDVISSYAQFKAFVEELYAFLPSFPMLEDYVPELDWGEIKYFSKDSLLSIFYGGVVERIPDFITAFELVQASNAQALNDMHAALFAQHLFLERVPSIDPVGAEIETGHIEVPAESFWTAASEALKTLSGRAELRQISPELAPQLGTGPTFESFASFGDAVIRGAALPNVFIDLGQHWIPLSLRNVAAAVVQHWAAKGKLSTEALGRFLSMRFKNVLVGPLSIVTRHKRYPFSFAAALLGGARPYVLAQSSDAGLSELPQIETQIKQALLGKEWAFKKGSDPGVVQIRNGVGDLPDQLPLIVVLSKVSTVPGVLKVPKTSTRILPLPDLVTILDEIEGIGELDRFWAFLETNGPTIGPFAGPVDRFAAFRDSNALLVEGAVIPSFIALDPHWGSNWRYRNLRKHWSQTPPSLPRRPETAWVAHRDPDDLFRLTGRGVPALSWAAVVGGCTTHFMLVVDEQPIAVDDGRILELAIHCLADALTQRRDLLAPLALFQREQIVVHCRADMASLVSAGTHEHASQPLFANWIASGTLSMDVTVNVNLQHVHSRLENAVDASFEAQSAFNFVSELSAAVGLAVPASVGDALRNSKHGKPRFTLKVMNRVVDVPDFADPVIARPEHYKAARRDLAIIFRELGATEGKYELADAKSLIDRARDRFRDHIHGQVAACRSKELAVFCVEQIDALTAKYDREKLTVRISLEHEVGYDRNARLVELQEAFVRDSRNYRYLLECCLSLHSAGSDLSSPERVTALIGSIDWLLVLYTASDVLHNGIDVAGIELDQFFVPHVFYNELTAEKESAFASEAADLRLGIGVRADDEVPRAEEGGADWTALDSAFKADNTVGFTKFLATLNVLFRWPSANQSSQLAFSYSEERDKVIRVLVDSVIDLTEAEAKAALAMVTLDPRTIRRLLGKAVDEGDVPIWEHNKRGGRYTIKPILDLGDGSILWGAAAVERAARIWRNALANGYLPADFEWPAVKAAVRQIKEGLEGQLETVAAGILSRGTKFVAEGFDAMRRFPKEAFEDVGDFDALAYWPEKNAWVSAECKYNQPAFCLKDARRLRDRIFGSGTDRAQFSKIERRRAFLISNAERIAALLGWPPAIAGVAAPVFHELYVSRDIYWWMRNPPYSVPTHFVRVDALDQWLEGRGLLKTDA
jgi:hypothetical protein